MVDWSAKSTPSPAAPSADSIWIGELTADGATQAELYCRTREVATDRLRALLVESVRSGERVLIGFDFPFGFPAGFVEAAGLSGGPPWIDAWGDLLARIEDGPRNENNRFDVVRRYNAALGEGPGPFWGCPEAQAHGGLTRRMKGLFDYPYETSLGPLRKFRVTEATISGNVLEIWRLAGVGSVGSQAIVGIPRVASLRFDPALAPVSKVWPFETGFDPGAIPAAGPAIVFAEIWPSIVDALALAALMKRGLIKDQGQVRLMCEWARDHDRAGTLAQYLEVPGLEPEDGATAVAEEGWILGCLAR
jgi:hypothetical protein